MLGIFQLDETDPLGRAYRYYLRLLGKCCLVFLILIGIAFVIGVPHIQSSYSFTGQRPANRAPSAEQKTAAWYFSITGWEHVRSGQYSQAGCPIILFVPIKDCLD